MKKLVITLCLLLWIIRLNTFMSIDTYYNNFGDTKPELYSTILADGITVYHGIMTVNLGSQMPKVAVREFSFPVTNISYYYYM